MELSTQQQMLVEQKLTNEAKSSGIAYVLWFFLGCFGAHRFYLGKTGSAVAQVVLWIGGILLAIGILLYRDKDDQDIENWNAKATAVLLICLGALMCSLGVVFLCCRCGCCEDGFDLCCCCC